MDLADLQFFATQAGAALADAHDAYAAIPDAAREREREIPLQIGPYRN
jgi:hypothetical protein